MLLVLAATDNDNLDKADHCLQTCLMDIMDAQMQVFTDNAYLELDGTFISKQVVDDGKSLVTLNFFLHPNFLELRCIHHTAVQNKEIDVWRCRLDPILLDFENLEWRSIMRPQLPVDSDATTVVTTFLHSNESLIRAFVIRGSKEIARRLQKDIALAWRRLDQVIGMRDDALLMTRNISPLKSTRTRAMEIDCRGFDSTRSVSTDPLDEIVCTGVDNVHLETMSEDHTWIGITLLDGRRLSVQIAGNNQVITAEIDDNPTTSKTPANEYPLHPALP